MFKWGSQEWTVGLLESIEQSISSRVFPPALSRSISWRFKQTLFCNNVFELVKWILELVHLCLRTISLSCFMHFFGLDFVCWNPPIMLCLSVRREVFCTTRYWLVSLSNQGFFIALKHSWSALLWKWLLWAPLFGGRLEFNYRKDWQVCDKDRSFQRWECCPLWGISIQTHLPCATAQKHLGRGKNYFNIFLSNFSWYQCCFKEQEREN